MTSTALQQVHSDHFVVKRNDQIEKLAFDEGFVCLGMRSYAPIMESLKQSFGNDIELINIGDSVRARRIIDGVAEGRNIINVLRKREFI